MLEAGDVVMVKKLHKSWSHDEWVKYRGEVGIVDEVWDNDVCWLHFGEYDTERFFMSELYKLGDIRGTSK